MKISRPRATKLSQLTIDADLVMGAHNITLGAGQTVDSIDVSDTLTKAVYDTDADNKADISGKTEGRIKNVPSASDTLKTSDDGEAEITASGENPPTTIVKTKTIPALYKSGTFRIKYDVRSGGSAGSTRTQLRKNGVAIGNLDIKSYIETGWETLSQDLGSIVGGDIITLCGSDDTGADGDVRYFRIYSTDAITPDEDIAW